MSHWLLPGSGDKPEALSGFPTGLLYGYCVYTTFHWPLEARWLAAHLDRLEADAQRIGLNWAYKRDALIEQVAACFQPDMPVIRLTAYTDVAGYGDFYSPGRLHGRLLLSARAQPTENGPVSLHSIRYQRPMPMTKLGAMPEIILAKRQAQAAGFQDVLLINTQGHLCEASTANIFLIRGDRLYTPDPARDGCLPGITRWQILEAAQHHGLAVQSDAIALENLPGMDGAFLTNAVQGVVAVRAIDRITFPWPERAQAMMADLRLKVCEPVSRC